MLRTIRQVPEEGDRKYLRDWARDEFKRNKSATNPVTASMREVHAGMQPPRVTVEVVQGQEPAPSNKVPGLNPLGCVKVLSNSSLLKWARVCFH